MAIVNPRQIGDFAKATGGLAKTDWVDAAVLARFAEAVRPEPRPLADEHARALSAVLLRRRPELEHLDRRRLAALVGVVPLNRDSGTLRGIRTVWGGRSGVRTTLHVATFCATRYNPAIREFYLQLAAAGKPKKAAPTACMGKLPTVLAPVLRNRVTRCPPGSEPERAARSDL